MSKHTVTSKRKSIYRSVISTYTSNTRFIRFNVTFLPHDYKNFYITLKKLFKSSMSKTRLFASKIYIYCGNKHYNLETVAVI